MRMITLRQQQKNVAEFKTYLQKMTYMNYLKQFIQIVMTVQKTAQAHLISANYLRAFQAQAPPGTTCGQAVSTAPTTRTPGTSAVRTRKGATTTAAIRASGPFVWVI